MFSFAMTSVKRGSRRNWRTRTLEPWNIETEWGSWQMRNSTTSLKIGKNFGLPNIKHKLALTQNLLEMLQQKIFLQHEEQVSSS